MSECAYGNTIYYLENGLSACVLCISLVWWITFVSQQPRESERMRKRRHRIQDLTVCYDHNFGNTIHYLENGCLGMCEKYFGERFCLVERNI